jgi:integrase/recombinase XerD
VLKVRGKGGKVVLTPLPPAVSRAIERAVADLGSGPILRTRNGTRMDRHCATRRLHRLGRRLAVCTPHGCIRTCCGTPS